MSSPGSWCGTGDDLAVDGPIGDIDPSEVSAAADGAGDSVLGAALPPSPL